MSSQNPNNPPSPNPDSGITAKLRDKPVPKPAHVGPHRATPPKASTPLRTFGPTNQ
ncbi:MULTISPECIES: hypothetical protein [unclassified Nocardia]|uniref:hypothetical protein n=1 Tax=unclassified Nocardia TaxID=2637762 RepID=UPI00278C28E3|nr:MULTISPECIES: hypothetical protein [unclassified Nocardia]